MIETNDKVSALAVICQEAVSNINAWEIEADKLFKALDEASLPEAEAYLLLNPPSAGAMGFLLLVARDKFKSERASVAARASHKDTDNMKIEVLNKYNAEKSTFKNKDEAAFAYTKHFPLAFSTLRNYLRGQ
ncbi:MAG: hypothetical protein V4440_07240 [Pseudomonadota bacterium]